MLNIELARKALAEVEGYVSGENGGQGAIILRQFIDSVERLIKYNTIKQVPVLFEPPKFEAPKG